MKKIILLVFVFVSLVAYSQPYQIQTARWEFTKGQQFDSAFRVYNLPILTGDTVIAFNPYSKKIGLKIITNDSIHFTFTPPLKRMGDNISITAAALSKVDDVNVTLTLGGSPLTSLLQATSLTLGWTGTLADSRITSAATWNAKENALTFSSGLTRTVNTITNDLSTGISGGQPVVGGTGSGENLSLSSTTHGTKGKILMAQSAYDEVNNRLGIGTLNPNELIEISGVDPMIRNTATATNGVSRFRFTENATTKFDFQYVGSTHAATSERSWGEFVNRSATGGISFWTNTTERLWINSTGNAMFAGNVYIGANTTPTAYLHLKAGTASASTSPVKLTAGPVNTTPESGTHEYDSSHYMTNESVNRFVLGGKIKDFITQVNNSGTGETDLYTYTTKANTLASNGEDLIFNASGSMNDATATSTLKVYFGGTAIATTSALAITGPWSVTARIKRINTTDVESTVTVNLSNGVIYIENATTTAITFTNTNIIKITGTAGGGTGGSNDITAKSGDVLWFGAANN